MTKDEAIKVLELLNAFYAGGKNDPKQQATAWYMVLGKYDFNDAMAAVLRFAESDTREYATFPAVGRIIAEIRKAATAKERLIREITTAVQYGRAYNMISSDAKKLIPEESYEKWLNVDPEEFALKADKFADFLRNRQLQLEQKE